MMQNTFKMIDAKCYYSVSGLRINSNQMLQKGFNYISRMLSKRWNHILVILDDTVSSNGNCGTLF